MNKYIIIDGIIGVVKEEYEDTIKLTNDARYCKSKTPVVNISFHGYIIRKIITRLVNKFNGTILW